MIRAGSLVFLAAFVLYGPSLEHFFVSDDFLNLERNAFRTVGEMLGFFATKDVDFYRPVPRLHFGFLQGWFADQVVAWNVIGALLHGVTSVAGGFLALSLLGPRNRRAARYVGLFFALHFIHAEAVVWASAVTTLYVTLFVFLALLLFRRARETGSVWDRTLSVVCFAAALLSKETAVAFVPLLLVTTWVWPVRRGGARLPTIGESLPYAVLLIAYGIILSTVDRGGDLSPYRITPGPHVLKNLAFFGLGGFVPVRYWEVQQLWSAAGASGGDRRLPGRHDASPRSHRASGAGGGRSSSRSSGRDRATSGEGWRGSSPPRFRFSRFRAAEERFLYLASFGACLVLGVGAQALLRRHPRLRGGRWTARGVVLAALTLSVAASVDRQRDWVLAGRWSREIVGRWSYLRELDPREPIEFVGIPGEYRSAWLFRNGFPSMVRLYWEGRPYGLEGELPAGSARDRRGVVLHPEGTIGLLPAHPSAGPLTAFVPLSIVGRGPGAPSPPECVG